MKRLLSLLIFFLFVSNEILSETIECQGAKIRVLNKDTTEKTFFILPLSQTLEVNNTNIVVHRCLKINEKDRQDEIALISHNHFLKISHLIHFSVGFLSLLITSIPLIILHLILDFIVV